MRRLDVVFRPRAEWDLQDILVAILRRGGEIGATTRFVDRIQARCMALADVPEQGTKRDELAPGIRTLGFERRVTLVFRVRRDRVEIVRILYRGRDVARAVR